MCDCNKEQNAGSSIGVLFNQNKAAIAQVFDQNGLNTLPVTLENTCIVAHARPDLGEQLAEALSNCSCSNVTGQTEEQKQAQQQKVTTAQTVLGLLGGLFSAGVGIAGLFGNQAAPEPNNAAAAEQANATAQAAPAPPTIFGLTPTQFFLLLAMLLGFGLLAFVASRPKA